MRLETLKEMVTNKTVPNSLLIFVSKPDNFLVDQYIDAICEYKMAIWLDSINVRAYCYLCQLYEEIQDFGNTQIHMSQQTIQFESKINNEEQNSENEGKQS